jgi:hypothetical protein
VLESQQTPPLVDVPLQTQSQQPALGAVQSQGGAAMQRAASHRPNWQLPYFPPSPPRDSQVQQVPQDHEQALQGGTAAAVLPDREPSSGSAGDRSDNGSTDSDQSLAAVDVLPGAGAVLQPASQGLVLPSSPGQLLPFRLTRGEFSSVILWHAEVRIRCGSCGNTL